MPAASCRPAGSSWRPLFPEDLFELRRREPRRRHHPARARRGRGRSRCSRAEMLPMCVLLLVAGFETTVNLIGNGVLALLGHRGQSAGPVRRPMRPGRPGRRSRRRCGSIRRSSSPTGWRWSHLDLEGQAVRPGQSVVARSAGRTATPRSSPEPKATFSISTASPGPEHPRVLQRHPLLPRGSRWPGWKPASRCGCWPSGCQGWRWPGPSGAATPRRSAGRCTLPVTPGRTAPGRTAPGRTAPGRAAAVPQ